MPRLLVADDSDIMRTVLLRLLGPHCEVVAVVNGQDAIAAAASQTFDGILLDIRMPGIDGVAACRSIRSGGFEGPIIALNSASVAGPYVSVSFCAGPPLDDFLRISNFPAGSARTYASQLPSGDHSAPPPSVDGPSANGTRTPPAASICFTYRSKLSFSGAFQENATFVPSGDSFACRSSPGRVVSGTTFRSAGAPGKPTERYHAIAVASTTQRVAMDQARSGRSFDLGNTTTGTGPSSCG